MIYQNVGVTDRAVVFLKIVLTFQAELLKGNVQYTVSLRKVAKSGWGSWKFVWSD